MQAVLWPIITWIFREVVLKFVIMGIVFVIISEFTPWVIQYVSPFIGAGSLTSAFASVSPGVWYFLDFFNLAYGVPLMISAFVARFIIRRIPFLG